MKKKRVCPPSFPLFLAFVSRCLFPCFLRMLPKTNDKKKKRKLHSTANRSIANFFSRALTCLRSRLDPLTSHRKGCTHNALETCPHFPLPLSASAPALAAAAATTNVAAASTNIAASETNVAAFETNAAAALLLRMLLLLPHCLRP